MMAAAYRNSGPPDRSQGGLSQDTVAMMRYQGQARSSGVAYLLWFFLGWFGGHRFYLGKYGTALILLAATALGFLIWVTYAITAVVLLYDLFTLPRQVAAYNETLLARIQSEAKG